MTDRDQGRELVTEIALFMMKSRMVRLRDPFGNVIGIISASEKRASVEDRPSESALVI